MTNHNIIHPDRTQAPAVASLSIPDLLAYRQFTLPNGIEIVYIHDPAQEVFKMDIIFEAGVYHQPCPLIASTAINMLNEGTRHHTADAIADLFDYYGAYTDFNCGLHKAELNLISLNKYARETIAMLAEMVEESIVPSHELDIYLTNKRQEFLVQTEKTAYLARKKFCALLFGETHPYANQIHEEDFSQVDRATVENFYRRYIRNGRCRIMICGQVNDEVLQTVVRCFGSLGASHPTPESSLHSFHPASAGRYHVEKKDSVQSSIRIGKKGVQLQEKDYAGFMLLNTILGGYFGSRLMSNIREEKGYTYGISSYNVSMPLNSYWCITTDVNNEYTEATIDEIFKEIRQLQTHPVASEELALVKNFLHGDLLRELDGVFAQSDALKQKLNYGLDNRIYLDLIQRIKQCSAEDLLYLANKYWKAEEMYVVTAGIS